MDRRSGSSASGTIDAPSDGVAPERLLDAQEVRASRHRGLVMGRAAKAIGLIVAVGALVLVTLLSLSVGARPIPLSEVVEALWGFDETDPSHTIVYSLRVIDEAYIEFSDTPQDATVVDLANRAALAEAFVAAGFEVVSSQANFVLVLADDEHALLRRLEDQGVAARPGSRRLV